MPRKLRQSVLVHLVVTLFGVSGELLQFLLSLLRPRVALSAENLFLRKQLAFYQERQIEPRRLNDMARICLVLWSRLFQWREALVVVKPATLIAWHRRIFCLFWRWKSRGGRPRLPKDIRRLIAKMVRENPTWGQAQVAEELALKLGIYVSPRTIRTYWPQEPLRSGPRAADSQRWQTFIRNHAHAMLACDFFVAVSARFQLLYVLVVMEIGTRRILHCNVTTHPTAAWTIQQMREAIPSDHQYRFLIHDRDGVFSAEVDAPISATLAGLQVPFLCTETHELGEELVASYLYQIHLYDWLERNDHGRFLTDNDL